MADALKRSGSAFSEAADSGEFPNLAARRSIWRLIDDDRKPVGPEFEFVSDAVDWRKRYAPLSMALPVEL